jgi:uncharacterized membrane protein
MTRRRRRTNATRRQQPAPLFVYWTLRTEMHREGWELLDRAPMTSVWVRVGLGTRYASLADALEARDRQVAAYPKAGRELRAVRWHARQA